MFGDATPSVQTIFSRAVALWLLSDDVVSCGRKISDVEWAPVLHCYFLQWSYKAIETTPRRYLDYPYQRWSKRTIGQGGWLLYLHSILKFQHLPTVKILVTIEILILMPLEKQNAHDFVDGLCIPHICSTGSLTQWKQFDMDFVSLVLCFCLLA